MAYFYGINKGEHISDVTIESSTQTKDVEIQVNATNVTDRQSLVNALDNLKDAIVRAKYPPV